MRTDLRRLRAPLLRWYRASKRDLPWRRTRDPYALWVSEVMLQQTTVTAVVPYWERFLARFPDVAALARAREEDVLAVWSGLGYYRRARALREGAIAVMERHGGRLPGDVDELQALPGIGRYTAGAVASLAFDAEAPVVDGNVRRVLSRLFAIAGRGASLERACWSIADELVRGPAPADLNQALMELGALICTPRAPACEACPLRRACAARSLGSPERFPQGAPRPRVRAIPVAVAWVESAGRVLLVRRPKDGLLRGTWDLPASAIEPDAKPRSALLPLLRRHGLSPGPSRVAAELQHTILARRLDIVVVAFETASPTRRAEHLWVSPARLDAVAISGATMKVARALGTSQNLSQASRSRSASGSSSGSGSSGRAKA
jgi:A/G-specific adenine glycosylase